MTISLHQPTIASMRSINFAAAAAAAVIGSLLVAGCSLASRQASLPAATTSVPATASTGSATGMPQAAGAASQAVSGGANPTPASRLPVSVESDSQMIVEGNNGPSSSILLPTSCQLTGTTITAEGTYTNGGFVPNVYDRYGDIIVLYVLGAPSPGYPGGPQLGVSDVSQSPVLGSQAPWHVSVSISSAVGAPASCVVAAQPTHDEQFAP
jgi:hypothetical protein